MWLFKRRFFAVLMLSGAWFPCFADGNGEAGRTFHAWCFAANVHTGFLIHHRSNMFVLSERRPYVAELFVAKRTHGDKDWQSFFGYPEYGVSLMMFDLGSPTYIGKGYGLYPFMNFFLRDHSKRFNLTVKAGGGAAYVEKIYDRVYVFLQHTDKKELRVEWGAFQIVVFAGEGCA